MSEYLRLVLKLLVNQFLMVNWITVQFPGDAVSQTCSLKKAFLEILQNLQENTCARVSFLIKLQAPPGNLLKKILAQVFSSEFCKISNNTFFTEYLWVSASGYFTFHNSPKFCQSSPLNWWGSSKETYHLRHNWAKNRVKKTYSWNISNI